ncbi:MAG: type II toxin-antitoxin system VapC family toxin [Nitrospira sp.]|jgi:tRNA(fMet)-specific endonuclease VapC|nr:MAG: type II toxin-antitoxin system VapC family toxin [Nitrospira sp.]
MKVMLDTNICIYLIKQRPPTVIDRFLSHPVGDIGVSSITVAELAYGVNKSRHTTKNRLALEQFLAPLDLAAFDQDAALSYGRLRALLEQKGSPIGSMDLLIAAHALSLGVRLVTNNLREFQRVPGLRLENWV